MSEFLDTIEFSVEWSNKERLSIDECDDYVYGTHGKILGLVEGSNDTEYNKSEVAEFSVLFVNVEKADSIGLDVEGVFCDYSQAMHSYYCALYEFGYPRFRHPIYEMYEEIYGTNLFIIDHLLIHPKFRKNNLGLQFIDFLISRFGHGASLVAIKPFPLQFGYYPDEEKIAYLKKWGLNQYGKKVERATQKLCSYYSKIGFRVLEDTSYMVRLGG